MLNKMRDKSIKIVYNKEYSDVIKYALFLLLAFVYSYHNIRYKHWGFFESNTT